MTKDEQDELLSLRLEFSSWATEERNLVALRRLIELERRDAALQRTYHLRDFLNSVIAGLTRFSN